MRVSRSSRLINNTFFRVTFCICKSSDLRPLSGRSLGTHTKVKLLTATRLPRLNHCIHCSQASPTLSKIVTACSENRRKFTCTCSGLPFVPGLSLQLLLHFEHRSSAKTAMLSKSMCLRVKKIRASTDGCGILEMKF